MTEIFGLLDCNNFYASCERVFKPAWQKRPIIILSNNDGCVIARSQEAKELGIEMGEPAFKSEYLVRKHNIVKCSSNFSLYGDFSQRVMTCLNNLVADIDVYSIDEAFIYFSRGKNADEVFTAAKKICQEIERATGISVSMGIGSSKTLAKLANKIAKKRWIANKKNKVFSLYFGNEDLELNNAKLDSYLCDFPVEDIWGIGRNFKKFLHLHGIYKAIDLKYANRYWLKQEMGVTGLRTAIELSGLACIPFKEKNKNDIKSIISSRSFGKTVSSQAELEEALANFVATAAYKLRRANKACQNLEIFLYARNNNHQNWRAPKIYNSIKLNYATNSSAKLINASHKALEEVFDNRLEYKKAGVVLTALKDPQNLQLPLFLDKAEEVLAKEKSLLTLVDSFNDQLGKNTVFWAAMGTSKKTSHWQAKQKLRSPCFTTNWQEIPKLR